MNSSLMQQYIEFVADRLLVAHGCPKLVRISLEWQSTEFSGLIIIIA